LWGLLWLLTTKRLNCLIHNGWLLLPGHKTLKPSHFFFAGSINLHRKTNSNRIVVVHSSKLLQLRTCHPLQHWL
jgi:hypothetical protein